MRTVGEERRGGARVLDVRFPAGGIDLEAYLVRPATDPPHVSIEVLGRLAPRPILLQHGERDYDIPAMAAVGLQRAAGGGAELRFYDGEHDLHLDAVRADRTAFLERVLEID